VSFAGPVFSGFVLAGGQSSRMGRDKALVELAGRPLIAYALEALRDAGLRAQIAGARSELSAFAPVVADREENAGPLSGVCAALAATQADFAVFLSVDLPLIPASLLRYLTWDAAMTGSAVTLASVNGFQQTFPAVVRCDALPVLEEELHDGRASCFAGFQSAAASTGETLRILGAESLAQSGHAAHPLGLAAARWFHNVNAPADLEMAELWLRRVLR
jgi:molybdenum cofactor guanylyltransferase